MCSPGDYFNLLVGANHSIPPIPILLFVYTLTSEMMCHSYCFERFSCFAFVKAISNEAALLFEFAVSSRIGMHLVFD